MDFICGFCNTDMTTAEVARQTLAVPHCIRAVEGGPISHAGPFERKQQTGRVQTRPEIVPMRYAAD